MLEKYFVKPTTVDRVRASWIGSEIESYADWLADQGYSPRTVLHRVPLVAAFGEFAHRRGVRGVGDLTSHIEAFVAERLVTFRRVRENAVTARQLSKEVRGPIEQMLEVVVPGFEGSGRPHRQAPFAVALPEFFEFLVYE